MSRNQLRALVCHPQTPSGSVDGISVLVTRVSDDRLTLSYQLRANCESIIIPGESSEQGPQPRVDELWRHTCFEAFLMSGDGPGYREYNFSPSREWASYTFSDYRQAHEHQTPESDVQAMPVISVHRDMHRDMHRNTHRDMQSLTVEAEIGLQPQLSKRSLRLGLSAVLEATDGSLCYWALRHPPGKPDFHHIDAFDLELDWPG